MTRYPWLLVILAVAFIVFVAAACTPPPPMAAVYDAANDVTIYNDAAMTQVAEWYGQEGVDWVTAHENGHRTVMQVWRTEHVALWTEMPGATATIQMEQAAQCEAKASGAIQPWTWGPDQVAAGYWDCPADFVALVKAAS